MKKKLWAFLFVVVLVGVVASSASAGSEGPIVRSVTTVSNSAQGR